MRDLLTAGLTALDLDPAAAPQLERYAELLLEKNKVMNLTAITAPRDVATLHLLDCAALAAQLDLSGKRVIDVGTGAGFPGMVLAILTPDARFTLLDSLGKRVDFLKEVQTDLGLKNVTCVHARAEEFAAQHREQFDLAASRAVAQLNVLCELTLPLVKVGGQFAAMKSVSTDEEIRQAHSAIAQLGGQLSGVTDYTVPETDVVHRIVSIEKTQHTPKQFPRAFARWYKRPTKGGSPWARSSPWRPVRAAPARPPSPPTWRWRWPTWGSGCCAWTVTSPCGTWIWRWGSATGR